MTEWQVGIRKEEVERWRGYSKSWWDDGDMKAGGDLGSKSLGVDSVELQL